MAKHDISAVVLGEMAEQPGITHWPAQVACASEVVAPPLVCCLKPAGFVALPPKAAAGAVFLSPKPSSSPPPDPFATGPVAPAPERHSMTHTGALSLPSQEQPARRRTAGGMSSLGSGRIESTKSGAPFSRARARQTDFTNSSPWILWRRTPRRPPAWAPPKSCLEIERGAQPPAPPLPSASEPAQSRAQNAADFDGCLCPRPSAAPCAMIPR